MTDSNPDGPVRPLVQAKDERKPTPYPYPIGDAAPPPLPQAGEFQGVILDTGDPFEAAMSDLIRVYRYRRPNLEVNGDIFATYAHSARALDMPQFGVPEALLHLLQKEQASINAMRRRGTLFNRDNDEAMGAYLEMAFHANMLYAWIKGWVRYD